MIGASQKISSKTDADTCIDDERGLAKLLDDWPMVDGGGGIGLVVGSAQVSWGADLRALGLDRKEVSARLKKFHAQMSIRIADRASISEGKLCKACTLAGAKLSPLAGMLHGAESDFQKTMRGSAADLASLQATMQVQRAVADKFGAHNLGSPLDGSLVSVSDDLSAKIQYYVAVFAALTFYRIAETWKPNSKNGAKHKGALVAALTSLNAEDRVVACECAYSHKVVAQMRKDAQVPARKLTPAALIAASGQELAEAETIAPTMAPGQSSDALPPTPPIPPGDVHGKGLGAPTISQAGGSARVLGASSPPLSPALFGHCEGEDEDEEEDDGDDIEHGEEAEDEEEQEKDEEEKSEEEKGEGAAGDNMDVDAESDDAWSRPPEVVAKESRSKARGAKRSRSASPKEQQQDLKALFYKKKV